MAIVKKEALWKGFDTEIKALLVLAILNAYKTLDISKDDIRFYINAPYFMDDVEDFVWFTIHLIETNNLKLENGKSFKIGRNLQFSGVEVDLLKRYLKGYRENNINPLQIFIEPAIENTIFNFVSSTELTKKIMISQ